MGAGDGFRGETFTGAGSPKGGSATGTVPLMPFFVPFHLARPLPALFFGGIPLFRLQTAGIMLFYIINNVPSDLISSYPQGEQGK